MAAIEPRVRQLLNALMERGFSWLAADIIELIEIGIPVFSEQDQDVAGQRRNLDSHHHDSTNLAEALSQPHSTTRPAKREEQASVATSVLTRQLVTTLLMNERSAMLLAEVAGAPVQLATYSGDLVRQIDPIAGRHAAGELLELGPALQTWLAEEQIG